MTGCDTGVVANPLVTWLLANVLPVAVAALAGALASWLAFRRSAPPAVPPRQPTPLRVPPLRVGSGVQIRVSELEDRNLDLVRVVVLLRDMASELAEATVEEAIIRIVVDRTRDLFPMTAGVAFYAPADGDAATLRLAGGAGNSGPPESTGRVGRGLVGQAAELRQVVTAPILRALLSSFELEAAMAGDSSPFPVYAAVPIIHSETIHGVLAIAHPGAGWRTDADGTDAPDPLRLLGVISDVAAVTLAHAANLGTLAESNRQLRELDRLKSDFVSMVSHDLRTPLTSVRSAIENLRDGVVGPINEQQGEYLDLMFRETARLVRMINDLLDLQKLEAGVVVLNRSRCHLRPIVDRVLAVIGPTFEARSIHVDDDDVDPTLSLQADPDRLHQIMFNLLDNASKFTPEGGRVEVAARERDGAVGVAVTNTGEPIAEDMATAIFERFRQVRDEQGRRPAGAGLGLAIAYRLVTMHGGRIWAKGVPGTGSRFAFTLPATPSPEQQGEE